jgi:hypothetical protein
MQKFNQILGAVGKDGGCGCGGDCQCQKDTDSDIGQSGAINPPEESTDKVIIHLDGGIEIHIPIAIAEVIKSALSDSPESASTQQ